MREAKWLRGEAKANSRRRFLATIWDRLRNPIFCLLGLFSLLTAQEGYNLKVIWEKAAPESTFAFGISLASGDLNGDGYSDIIIAGDTTGLNIDFPVLGKVWIFYGGPDIDTIPDVILKSHYKAMRYVAVASGGDFNMDGYDDVLVCDVWPDVGPGMSGVEIYFGGTPMDTIPALKIKKRYTPAFVGDINGDGYDDFALGYYAAGFSGIPNAGKVYIYFGSPNLDTIPDVILNGGHDGSSENFGQTLGGRGDVNRDGFNDIIVAAPGYSPPGWAGKIYIYFGGAPMDTIFQVAMRGEKGCDFLGEVGVDLLRNKKPEYDYAIIGHPWWKDERGKKRGKIYILYGGSPMDNIPDASLSGKTNSSRFGWWPTKAGDLNYDEYDELITGAPYDPKNGSAYIFFHYLKGIYPEPSAWLKGSGQFDGVGWKVASAGDVDGDGRDEILISNYASDHAPKRVWLCKYTGPVAVADSQRRIADSGFKLEIYPNPIKEMADIRFQISLRGKVNLNVYDASGQLVSTITKAQNIRPGFYTAHWNGLTDGRHRVPSGVYFCELLVKGDKETVRVTKKMVVVK